MQQMPARGESLRGILAVPWQRVKVVIAAQDPRLRLFLRNRGSLLILDWHEMWRGPILLVLGALAHP